MTDALCPAPTDGCVHCGARPIRDIDGRIAGWALPRDDRPDLHRHEVATTR